MKLSKKLVAILLLAVMVVSLAACSSNSIVGKWKFDHGDGDYTIYEFKENGKLYGTFHYGGQVETDETTYTVDGDKLTFEGVTYTFKVDGDKLQMTAGSATANLTRVK